ncbi:MAG: hypothetical protein KGY74_10875 [Candidatus Cloacimonetes bacterium]|nr:hypothetical protein [Candidatus Cloacimonadota bacterium]
MNNEVVQKLWFDLNGKPPKNFWGKIPKKYRDYYAIDKKGNWLVKKELGFLFTQYAWFISFDYHEVDPSQFDEIDESEKLLTLSYGAAKYWCWINSVDVFFTRDDLIKAWKRNTQEANEEIVKALQNAVFDEWMKAFMEEEEQGPEAAKKK